MNSNPLLDEYILKHIDEEGDYLYRLYRATNVELLHGRMVSGHLQGRILKMFVRMIKPKNILEIGTFSGYSALCMAEGLADDGIVYTFDINDELEPFTRKWINGSEIGHKIDYRIGDVMQIVPSLDVIFDMVFIDGDKRSYIDYYEMAMIKLRSGGFIIADNTLWDGHVIDKAYDKDRQTHGIDIFNKHVADDKRVEKVIFPLRDGLTILHKL